MLVGLDGSVVDQGGLLEGSHHTEVHCEESENHGLDHSCNLSWILEKFGEVEEPYYSTAEADRRQEHHEESCRADLGSYNLVEVGTSRGGPYEALLMVAEAEPQVCVAPHDRFYVALRRMEVQRKIEVVDMDNLDQEVGKGQLGSEDRIVPVVREEGEGRMDRGQEEDDFRTARKAAEAHLAVAHRLHVGTMLAQVRKPEFAPRLA